jgi:hypothetical protein
MVNFFVSRAFLTGVPIALTIYYLLPTARFQVPFLVGTSLSFSALRQEVKFSLSASQRW